MKRYFLLLVILIILGGGSPLPGQEAPQVLLLSSSLDYFSTFLEVHLRRLLSPSRVRLIPLCSLEELSLGFPPEKAFLIVFLGEEKYFSSILSPFYNLFLSFLHLFADCVRHILLFV